MMLRRAAVVAATGVGAAWVATASTSDHPSTAARLVRDVVGLGRIVQVYSTKSPDGGPLDSDSIEQTRRDVEAAGILLNVCRSNGGVYIKLGQMIAVLSPLVPEPYADVLRVLFDEAPQSSIADVHRTLEEELGRPVNEIFTDFDTDPIGVASLAQVHVATLRHSGEKVAVKVQHPTVQASAAVDLVTITYLIKGVRWLYPSVDYVWLAEESQRNVPLELDFNHEAANAARCARNFAHRDDVVVPTVHREYTTGRVLTMSLEAGVSPTNAAAVEAYGLSKYSVANVIASALNEQIFIHGFVHADPHPGNLLVRPRQEPTGGWGRWVTWPLRWLTGTGSTTRPELVILDHGLYREIDTELRTTYATFWRAILGGDTTAMKSCAETLGAGDLYPLLACVLTRKPWDVIVTLGEGDAPPTLPIDPSSARLVVSGDADEVAEMQKNFRQYLATTFAMLARLNPDLLLLLKTNDCIHHLLTALESPSLYYVWVARWTAEVDSGRDEQSTLASARARAVVTISSWVASLAGMLL